MFSLPVYMSGLPIMPRFLHCSTVDIMGQIVLSYRGSLVHCRMFKQLPWPLLTKCKLHPSPSIPVTSRNVSRHCQVSRVGAGVQFSLVETTLLVYNLWEDKNSVYLSGPKSLAHRLAPSTYLVLKSVF